jgi:type IV secretory pathway VirB2 component (pilin)
MDEVGSHGTSAIQTAMDWITSAMAGSAATAIAVIAIALVGFAMLNGRVSPRRAMSVLLGCFLVFGARDLTVGFISAVWADSAQREMVIAPPPPPAPVKKPKPYNPYSKASMGE